MPEDHLNTLVENSFMIHFAQYVYMKTFTMLHTVQHKQYTFEINKTYQVLTFETHKGQICL